MARFIIEKLEDGKYKHCLSVEGGEYMSPKIVWMSQKYWFLRGEFRVYKADEFEKAECFSRE